MELQQYIKLKKMMLFQEQQIFQLSLNIDNISKLLNDVVLDDDELKEYILDFYYQYDSRLDTIKHLKEITNWSLKDCHEYVLAVIREDQVKEKEAEELHKKQQ